MKLPHCAATVSRHDKSDQQQKSLEQEPRRIVVCPRSLERGYMSFELGNHVDLEQLRQEQNLYGARLFMSGEHDPAAVEGYIRQQEKTHLAEGLELQQRSLRALEYYDGQTRGFGGQPMVDINQAGYRAAHKKMLAGDETEYCLVRRRSHDVTISQRQDVLMANGEVGDGFMVITPYQEELDDSTARDKGFWPEYRRAYLWWYRKVSDHELECVDVSIDQSSLTSFKKLLAEYGQPVAGNIPSHEIPGFVIPIKAETEIDRDQQIDSALQRYRELNDDPVSKRAINAFEAMEFLDLQAGLYLDMTVSVHRAVAETLASGDLHQLVRLSASRALRNLHCLDEAERLSLQQLLTGEVTTNDIFAISTVIAAQRYGIWQAISKLASGEQLARQFMAPGGNSMEQAIYQARLLDHIYANTNQAAAEFKTMPGCAGGTSFLEQDQNEVKASIFSGEKYSFNKKTYCVVCQAPPKEKESPKWCGPCGICRPCDTKIQSKNRAAV